MNLFYQPNIDQKSKEVRFDKEESRHLIKVLRMKEGDNLKITNGIGCFFDAKIISSDPKHCLASVLNVEKVEPLPYSLHLAVAPTKLNDRFEWFLEKATEIGITEITPIICDHSERKVIKPERYEKILQSAMKQSLKAYLPVLNEATKFSDFISASNSQQKLSTDLKFIAHCEETKKQTLKSALKVNRNVTILIGPEGDFSVSEIQATKDCGYVPVSLGNSRLRTETAAIVACHSVAFINER